MGAQVSRSMPAAVVAPLSNELASVDHDILQHNPISHGVAPVGAFQVVDSKSFRVEASAMFHLPAGKSPKSEIPYARSNQAQGGKANREQSCGALAGFFLLLIPSRSNNPGQICGNELKDARGAT